MSLAVITCESCGQPFERPEPSADLSPRWRQLAERACTHCDSCCDRLTAQREAEQDEEERQRQEQALLRRIDASGLPAALRGLDEFYARPGQEQGLGAAQAWADGELAGLLLTGPVGAGKTYLAAWAAWRHLARRRLRWYSAPQLLMALSAAFESPVRERALVALSGQHALCLDDLDKARPSEFGAEQMYAAIDAQLVEGRPLMVTSNRTLDELAQRWPQPVGEAIASRLAGYCRVVEVTGPDRRTEEGS